MPEANPHVGPQVPDKTMYETIKRVLDIVVAAAGIVLLSPVMGVIALAVAKTSPGPILFRQKRVGLNGNDFALLKFRTMTCLEGSEEGLFTPGDQCRVTGVGRVLRATKLDELPQFFNVLRGDMSLVGPRPEVREWVDVSPEKFKTILEVKPGIFDPAVSVFRNEEQLLAQSENPRRTYREEILPAKLQLNRQYVAKRSLKEDLKVLTWGVLSVFIGQARQEKR